MKNILKIATLALGMLALTAPSHATLSSASGNASPTSVQINTTGFSLVQWQTSKSVSAPLTLAVKSTEGTFRDLTGNILGRTSTLLSTTLVATAAGSYTLTMSESLNIPLGVIRTAQSQGDSSFFYERTFIDAEDNSTRTARVQFSIQSSGVVIAPPTTSNPVPPSTPTTPGVENPTPTAEPSSLLRIDDMQLRFADNRSSAIISRETPLQASVVLNYTGTGVINYQWELASPPSTQGHPIYIPINSQRQYLLAGGRVVISSPQLPSDRTGEYLLRLRINQPSPSFISDTLRYVVRRDVVGGDGQTAIQEIEPLFPATGARTTPETEFQWQAVAGATAYQLEIYDSPRLHSLASANQAPTPITGVLIPATKNRLTLGAVSWRHLRIGEQYWWRVVALAADGRAIGRSPLREMQTP